MNERPTLLKPVGPESLADERDFQLGGISVRPSLREVIAGERREILEPRVMQVLVALARANGAVVSRDELIRRCWGGRIVSEDAINRAVSKIRQIADLASSKAFEIETIPRVGYRLREVQRQQNDAEAIAPPAAAIASLNAKAWRWIGLGVVAIAIAAGLAAALSSYLRREPEWTVAESHLPFISTADIESYPAIAPDGTMIAYSAGPDSRSRHIYLRLIKGGDPIQLTHDAYDAAAPAWSSEGRMIAYVIFQEGHPCRILEIPVPAGQSREVGRCRVSQRSSLSFDQSGRSLFYVDAPMRGATERIFKLDLDSGHVSAVAHPGRGPFADTDPAVSPDGSTLLYARNAEADRIEVRVLMLANGVDRLIAAFDGLDNEIAAWSADGQTIFLARSDSGDKSLWAYALGGGNPRRIVTTDDKIERLSAGPNGLLAMEMSYPAEQLIAVTPHSGLPPKPIPSGGLRTVCVDYAPDGTFLATGRRADTWGVWIGGTNGTLPGLLTTSDSPWAIRWSPDGTRFAFLEWWHGHGVRVRVLKREGEQIAQFHYPGNDTGLLDWTADGRSILTSRQEAKGWRIWRTDLATPDKSVPITPYGWRDPRIHGSMLFAEKIGLPGIWRIDGTPRHMTDGPAPEASDAYNIAGDRLIYSDTSDPKHPMFSAVSVNGGPKDRLAPLPHAPMYYTFGIDPKSGDIVYTQQLVDRDIGLLRLEKR